MMNDKYLKNIRLERYINQIKFLGIPMGGTLSDQFQLGDIHGIQSMRNTAKDLLVELLRVLLSIFRRKSLILNTKVIATWIANKHHYNNMMIPLVEHFNQDLTVIYNPEIKNVNELYNANFITIKETFITPLKYIPSLTIFISAILIAFITRRKRLSLNNRELFYYSLRLFHQGRIIAFYDHQFKNQKYQVRLVVTEYDRNSIASPLVLTAKKHGIKTVTLVHGVIEATGFTPLLADYIFCFGEIQKNQLLEQHVPTRKIRVTGTSIIPTFKELERKRKRKDPVLRVCLGISPINQEHLNNMINTVVTIVSDTKSVELIIKLHPSQKKENFIHLEKQHKNIKVLSSKEIDNMDLFVKIDLLIINFSGLGVEAMYQKVPVILMKTHKEETGMVALIVKWSSLPVFETRGELNSILSEIMTDRSYLTDLSEKGKNFSGKYYHATGVKASQNIIQELNKVVNLS